MINLFERYLLFMGRFQPGVGKRLGNVAAKCASRSYLTNKSIFMHLFDSYNRSFLTMDVQTKSRDVWVDQQPSAMLELTTVERSLETNLACSGLSFQRQNQEKTCSALNPSLLRLSFTKRFKTSPPPTDIDWKISASSPSKPFGNFETGTEGSFASDLMVYCELLGKFEGGEDVRQSACFQVTRIAVFVEGERSFDDELARTGNSDIMLISAALMMGFFMSVALGQFPLRSIVRVAWADLGMIFLCTGVAYGLSSAVFSVPFKSLSLLLPFILLALALTVY